MKNEASLNHETPPLQQTAIRRSASSKFKVGDIVSLRNDEQGRFWVAKKDGKKCLKMAGCLGWMYFQPENWDDVFLRIRP
jgi:hypothetical protein